VAERVSRVEAECALLAAVCHGVSLRTWRRWRRMVRRLLAEASVGMPWQIGGDARDGR